MPILDTNILLVLWYSTGWAMADCRDSLWTADCERPANHQHCQ